MKGATQNRTEISGFAARRTNHCTIAPVPFDGHKLPHEGSNLNLLVNSQLFYH